MTDIQRWDLNHVQGEVYIDKNAEGSWVTFADAEAAIDEARSQEAKVHAATERYSPLSYLQGQRDMLAKCIAELEALMAKTSGDRFHGFWDALAALCSLQEKP